MWMTASLIIIILGIWIQTINGDVIEVNYRNVDQQGQFSSHVTVFEWDTVILPCQYSVIYFNQSGLKSYWQVNITEISENDFIYDRRNIGLIRGQGSYKIKLGNLRPFHSGRYRCTIEKVNYGILHREQWHLKVVESSHMRFIKISSSFLWAHEFSRVNVNCTVGGMRPRLELGWLKRIPGGWKRLHNVTDQLFQVDTTRITRTLTFDMADQDEELRCKTLNAEGIDDIGISAIVKVIRLTTTSTTQSPPTTTESEKGFEVINLSIVQYGPYHIVLDWTILYHQVFVESPNCTVTYRAAHEEIEYELTFECPTGNITTANVTGLRPATVYIIYVTVYTSNFTSEPSEEVAGSTSLHPPTTQSPPPLSSDVDDDGLELVTLRINTERSTTVGGTITKVKRGKPNPGNENGSNSKTWNARLAGFASAIIVITVAMFLIMVYELGQFGSKFRQRIIELVSFRNPLGVISMV